MKRICSLILPLLLLFGIACAPTAPASMTDRADTALSVVTTIFPIYDWTREILGSEADVVELSMLLDSGVDLHSFQPSAEDIVRISTCDVFLYVGGESDEWVGDALKESQNPNQVVINLLDLLGDAVKEEEVIEGMQDEEHDHEEEKAAYDEHVWLSLKNAAYLCEAIAARLGTADPDHAALYRSNADAYIAKLNTLDAAYAEAVNGATYRTVLFGDRFPFRYLVDDYDLSYYAAFAGCSAETEASFETIVFLAGKLDELGLPAILQIESADGSIARTIQQATKTKDQAILTLDSLQSVTAVEVQNGTSYLDRMAQNLEVWKQALH